MPGPWIHAHCHEQCIYEPTPPKSLRIFNLIFSYLYQIFAYLLHMFCLQLLFKGCSNMWRQLGFFLNLSGHHAVLSIIWSLTLNMSVNKTRQIAVAHFFHMQHARSIIRNSTLDFLGYPKNNFIKVAVLTVDNFKTWRYHQRTANWPRKAPQRRWSKGAHNSGRSS